MLFHGYISFWIIGVFAPRQSFRDIFACHGGAFHLLPDNIACPNTGTPFLLTLTDLVLPFFVCVSLLQIF